MFYGFQSTSFTLLLLKEVFSFFFQCYYKWDCFFLISLSNCLLQVARKIIDVCILSLHCATLPHTCVLTYVHAVFTPHIAISRHKDSVCSSEAGRHSFQRDLSTSPLCFIHHLRWCWEGRRGHCLIFCPLVVEGGLSP
jgi:hypothetical protein